MAASPDFWADNAVHLPQMIATGWLSLKTWQEAAGAVAVGDDTDAEPALPLPAARRAPVAGHARRVGVGRARRPGRPPRGAVARLGPPDDRRRAGRRRGRSGRDAPASPRRGATPRGRARAGPEPPRGARLLESILLGAAYPLGLVRAAEERGTGRRVVQLTPLGRYVLAAGPTPPPRPTFEQFLFVQPNFEVIAYRQGLTPQLVGRLSRFAWWSQIGAALELRLTRESIVLGLEGGLTPESMLDAADAAQPAGPARRRGRRGPDLGHAPRAGDLLRGGDPDRVRLARRAGPGAGILAARATRIASRRSPSPIGSCWSRTSATIPFDRFRMAGSRDYRRPPEACVTVEPDGVSMALDPARSDLLVDAELGRFADELPASRPVPGGPRSRPGAGSW